MVEHNGETARNRDENPHPDTLHPPWEPLRAQCHRFLSPQFVVVQSCSTLVVPKKRIISFQMANDGYKWRKITKINACDNYNHLLLWSIVTDTLVAPPIWRNNPFALGSEATLCRCQKAKYWQKMICLFVWRE